MGRPPEHASFRRSPATTRVIAEPRLMPCIGTHGDMGRAVSDAAERAAGHTDGEVSRAMWHLTGAIGSRLTEEPLPVLRGEPLPPNPTARDTRSCAASAQDAGGGVGVRAGRLLLADGFIGSPRGGRRDTRLQQLERATRRARVAIAADQSGRVRSVNDVEDTEGEYCDGAGEVQQPGPPARTAPRPGRPRQPA